MESGEKVNDTSVELEQKTQEELKSPEEQESKPRNISKLEHALPYSSMSSMERFLASLKAYVVASSNGAKAICYTDFNGVVNFDVKVISGTNKFFKEIGLIEPEKGKPGYFRPTKELIEFIRLRDWDQEEDAKKVLRDVLKSTWFVESAEMVLSMNNPASEAALLSKLGIESGAERGKHDGPIRTVLDLMDYAGIVRRNEDGTYSRGSNRSIMPRENQANHLKEAEKVDVVRQEARPRETVIEPIKSFVAPSEASDKGCVLPISVQLVFNISNDTTPERLKEIVKAIKEAFTDGH